METAILRATVARLAADGYSRMTIGDIAADAGVTRPTVYRRWANKRQLVMEALDFSFQQDEAEQPTDHIDALGPVAALKEALRLVDPRGLHGRGLKIVGNALVEAEREPDLLELVRRHAVEPRTRVLGRTLRRLDDEGLLRPGLDLGTLADLCLGSYYSAYLRSADTPTDLPDRVVDTLWPLIAAPGAAADT
ncbi:TetR/AcrR family transcriptional regulator [Streptomyces sp. 8L]|uniref:TetR/AcrR family transcriptional regulator n=1 Tax=unclassified Streptomyces TaxID=2593676 RepID=UPI001CD1F81F|nr:TetR/AcrR family transcriptional regulator [Streptomyces sp. 8L]MCA1219017.1 TetR/AcrR family transcriptional regulator [Streptomyces sp. 8L]